MQDKFVEELTCPITFELFEDPISVPCCGKTFSRKALCDAFVNQINNINTCPLCNGNLSRFDPKTAPSNKNILSFVELIKNQQLMKQQLDIMTEKKYQQQQPQQPKVEEKEQKEMKQEWSACIKKMYDLNEKKRSNIAELQISLTHSVFNLVPSLFIIVVDKSGSMAGSAWNQVKTALNHISGIANANKLIQTVFITYDSKATIHSKYSDIAAMQASGGTNFQSAFDKIKEILIKYKADCMEGRINENISICFLTDGQDNSSSNRKELVPNFKKIIRDYWVKYSHGSNGNVVVHAIGFGSGCDKHFLEELRSDKLGTFRYAEPSDLDEMLCSKLKALFAKISASTAIPITLDLKDCEKLFSFYKAKSDIVGAEDDQKDNVMAVQFPVSSDKCGVFTQWIELLDVDIDDEKKRDGYNIYINSEMDKHKCVNIAISMDDNNINKESNMELFNKWMLTLTDDLAAQIYNLSNEYYTNYDEITFDLHCALIQQNCQVLEEIINVDNKSFLQLTDKIEYLLNAIIALRQGLSINMGKISDMRFASQFASSSRLATSNKHCDRREQLEEKYRQIDLFGEEKKSQIKREILHKYAFDNKHKDRNKLQTMIMDMLNDKEIIAFLNSENIDEKDILYVDNDGNNALHLCCYAGKFNVVKEILSKYGKHIDIEYENPEIETALTLAIKKRGYYQTIRVLLSYQAKIDPARSEALEQFAINNNYVITAKLIRDLRTNSSDPNKFMSREYLIYLYEDAMQNNKEIDVQKYLQLFLSKQMTKYVKLMINKHNGVVDIDMLLKYCIPPKPDGVETEKYLNLSKILLNKDKTLLNQQNKALETALFKAAEKGGLAHCEYFLSLGCAVDTVNELGNTPLWISAAKLYPCIMKLLISHGADVNHQNIKGNPPLYNFCIRGNEKVCNLLLSTNRVQIENMTNKNGDTLILICCRNKNWKILPLLLNYVSLEFVNFRAHIDGFNAIFASVETNSVECIKILHSFGVDLNQKTEDDNAILAGATPLHLACYYKRYESAKVLLSLGANVNAMDNIHKQIPLTLAVIQLNIEIIKLLARKSNISLKDNYGNTPLSYCQNNIEIRKLLINPLLDVLNSLCTGKFRENKERIACNVLRRYCGLSGGCFATSSAVNICDSDGMTPLIYAVINKKYNIIKTLFSLNADPNIKNKYGVNCFIFNKWIKNIQIQQILAKYYDALSQNQRKYVEAAVNRLEKANSLSWFNSFTLNMNAANDGIFTVLTYSGIAERMQMFIQNVTKANDSNAIRQKLLALDLDEINKKYDENAVEGAFKFNDKQFDENKYLNIILNCKLFTINYIAGEEYGGNKDEAVLSEAKDIFLLNLYTNNDILCSSMNYEIINNLANPNINILYSIKLLNNILMQLASFIGEVFVGCNKRIDRSLFLVNSVFSWNAFISGSSQWRMAINNLPDFTTKKNEGTVFLIKSKTGKHIGKYSQFSFESEVIFKPNTTFKVTQWYKGDVICLGQENIRKNTFGIQFNEEMNKYLNSNKALIIELEEVYNTNTNSTKKQKKA